MTVRGEEVDPRESGISREEGLALFNAFASKEKSLHVNSGKHKELPRFEVDSAVRFFARHLGGAVNTSA